ncbi:MAG: dihydrolipoamide acetyltransferase [Myxococcaceae bacterium]
MNSRRLVGLVAMLVTLAPAFAQTPAPGGAATPSPAPATTTAAPAAPGASPQTADEAFQTRVKQLEEQVVDLKEKIFRTKARLLLLQETVLGGDISQGARAIIYHRKEMSAQFVLESVAYALDGAPIFTKVDTNDDLNKREEFEIFNGRIVPGNHQIAVRMVYRGAGGVFSYAEGYKFKLQSNQTFTAEGGKITTVKVVGYEKGGITAEMKDKPAIRYDISTTKEQGNAPSGDQSQPGAATNP